MSTEHLLRTMSVVNADIVEERERLTLEKKHFYEQVATFSGDNRLLEDAVVVRNNEVSAFIFLRRFMCAVVNFCLPIEMSSRHCVECIPVIEEYYFYVLY